MAAVFRQMGESNAVRIRQPRYRHATWQATKAAYQTTLTQDERDSGSIPATFQVGAWHLATTSQTLGHIGPLAKGSLPEHRAHASSLRLPVECTQHESCL